MGVVGSAHRLRLYLRYRGQRGQKLYLNNLTVEPPTDTALIAWRPLCERHLENVGFPLLHRHRRRHRPCGHGQSHRKHVRLVPGGYCTDDYKVMAKREDPRSSLHRGRRRPTHQPVAERNTAGHDATRAQHRHVRPQHRLSDIWTTPHGRPISPPRPAPRRERQLHHHRTTTANGASQLCLDGVGSTPSACTPTKSEAVPYLYARTPSGPIRGSPPPTPITAFTSTTTAIT